MLGLLKSPLKTHGDMRADSIYAAAKAFDDLTVLAHRHPLPGLSANRL